MPNGLTSHEPLLLQTLAHLSGTLVFGIFVVLLVGDRAGARLPGRRLAMATAILACVWNFSSLLSLGIPDMDSIPGRLVLATGTSALSLLPAVLLHLVLAERQRSLTFCGYLLSAFSVVVHCSEVVLPAPDHHRWAMLLVTGGFGLLTATAAVCILSSGEQNRRRMTSRLAGTMLLFLFAMSFFHLGAVHSRHGWLLELLLHHAGIPLALYLLLQEYRAVFLDAIVRFLANILLAVALALASWELAKASGLVGTELGEALLVAAASVVLILFALLRARVQTLLTHLVFQRPPIHTALADLREPSEAEAGESGYLRRAAAALARYMDSCVVDAVAGDLNGSELRLPVPVSALPAARERLESQGVEVVVPIRLPQGGERFVFLGRRTGGRRYLSEDLDALAELAAEVVERLERFRENEMRRLVAQAELRALESQIHPHFLFNALNTLYGVIPREAAGARRTVLNLADIFRYFLQSDKTYIPFDEELRVVKSYLEIESLRLGPKLIIEYDIDPRVLQVPIPLLSIEPLVENAVKHGVAARAEGGLVRLEAQFRGEYLQIRVIDTGPGFASGGRRGVGMENVSRRLQLCYGQGSTLEVESGPGRTAVGFSVPVHSTAHAGVTA